MTSVPILETERTILRAHRPDDLDAYAAMWTDPVIIRFIGGKPRSREESWIRILRYAGMWQLVGFGFWAIEEKTTGKLIGEAGFHEMKRDIVPSFEGTPEAGWAFVSSAHGRGLAFEAMRRAHEWAADMPGFEKTVCIIDPENGPSLSLAGKLGYRERTTTAYHGDPSILLER